MYLGGCKIDAAYLGGCLLDKLYLGACEVLSSGATGSVIDANTLEINFPVCVNVLGTTGVEISINGGAWETVAGSSAINLVTEDPFDVNAHQANNGLVLTPGDPSLLTFPASSAGAHLWINKQVFTINAGDYRLGWRAWTDSGSKVFRVNIYDAVVGHLGVEHTATTTKQWVFEDFTVPNDGGSPRVQNDLAGSAGDLRVEALFLGSQVGPDPEDYPAETKTVYFSTTTAISGGDVVRWRYVGGSGTIVDCENTTDVGDLLVDPVRGEP